MEHWSAMTDSSCPRETDRRWAVGFDLDQTYIRLHQLYSATGRRQSNKQAHTTIAASFSAWLFAANSAREFYPRTFIRSVSSI
jgi:hypothetical protein